ncbi:MAG TPA: TetR/AcrR family transcriptional regulator [Ktedonobacterales bacterium]
MGRPREYDERAASDLLQAAERIVAEEGLDGLSVRRLASEAGCTTRAVYSLYGSKDGLVVALGAHAFHLLREALEALPATSDPVGDVVEAGVRVFRRFALDHPALLRIGFLQTGMAPDLACQFRDAGSLALDVLKARIARLGDSGQLGSRNVADATCEFHALCEGLAALESRRALLPGNAERIWRDALRALVSGWGAAPVHAGVMP